MGENSPHGIEVIIRRYVILIITGQTQFIPITLMDKVPQLLGTQWLDKNKTNSGWTWPPNICFQPIIECNAMSCPTLFSRAFCQSLNIIMYVRSLAPNEVKKCWRRICECLVLVHYWWYVEVKGLCVFTFSLSVHSWMALGMSLAVFSFVMVQTSFNLTVSYTQDNKLNKPAAATSQHSIFTVYYSISRARKTHFSLKHLCWSSCARIWHERMMPSAMRVIHQLTSVSQRNMLL